MSVCEFCRQFQNGECRLGLNIPKTMSCRDFDPSMAQFCSDPRDFVDHNQILQMAKFFGFQRTELKKIKLMATQEETTRTQKQKDDRLNDLTEEHRLRILQESKSDEYQTSKRPLTIKLGK